jgi:hypothetical protein
MSRTREQAKSEKGKVSGRNVEQVRKQVRRRRKNKDSPVHESDMVYEKIQGAKNEQDEVLLVR